MGVSTAFLGGVSIFLRSRVSVTIATQKRSRVRVRRKSESSAECVPRVIPKLGYDFRLFKLICLNPNLTSTLSLLIGPNPNPIPGRGFPNDTFVWEISRECENTGESGGRAHFLNRRPTLPPHTFNYHPPPRGEAW